MLLVVRMIVMMMLGVLVVSSRGPRSVHVCCPYPNLYAAPDYSETD